MFHVKHVRRTGSATPAPMLPQLGCCPRLLPCHAWALNPLRGIGGHGTLGVDEIPKTREPGSARGSGVHRVEGSASLGTSSRPSGVSVTRSDVEHSRSRASSIRLHPSDLEVPTTTWHPKNRLHCKKSFSVDYPVLTTRLVPRMTVCRNGPG